MRHNENTALRSAAPRRGSVSPAPERAPGNETGFHLPAREFRRAFPFHLALRADTTILAVGDALARLCPEIRVGDALSAHFRVVRPARAALAPGSIPDLPGAVFFLALDAQRLELRGQMMRVEGTDHFLFLGSPWGGSRHALLRAGVSLADFAPHDASLDYLARLELAGVCEPGG